MKKKKSSQHVQKGQRQISVQTSLERDLNLDIQIKSQFEGITLVVATTLLLLLHLHHLLLLCHLHLLLLPKCLLWILHGLLRGLLLAFSLASTATTVG
jgi:hypothetical protein